jgi:hypothetical protein
MPRELAVPTHRSQRRLSGRMTGQPPNRPFANRILEHNHVEKSQLGGSSHSRQATPGQHKAAAECTQPKASNLRCRPVTDQVQSDYQQRHPGHLQMRHQQWDLGMLDTFCPIGR